MCVYAMVYGGSQPLVLAMDSRPVDAGLRQVLARKVQHAPSSRVVSEESLRAGRRRQGLPQARLGARDRARLGGSAQRGMDSLARSRCVTDSAAASDLARQPDALT